MLTCQECGEVLPAEFQVPSKAGRKFCDRRCMAKNFTDRPTDRPLSWGMAHLRSRRLVPPGPCEKCGKPNAIDVHHRDR